jgi:large subunit ribosomal protein L23
MKDVYQVIHKVLLSEKGLRLSETENKYLFSVAPTANKAEIRQAVEELFKVKVTAVNTMKRQGKNKRERTPSAGRTAACKRAVVTLAEGSKIELV